MIVELRQWLVPIMVVSISSWTLWLTNRKGNLSSAEHAIAMAKQEENGRKIDNLDGKVVSIGTKLDGHLGWHKGNIASHPAREASRRQALLDEFGITLDA